MTQEIGIYRGSFDPPHNGHLEVVAHCLRKQDISRIIIVYKDTNPYKPFRSSDEDRRALLTEMFKRMNNVVISECGFKAILKEAQSDTTISKIYRIVGSDIFGQREISHSKDDKVMTLVIPRNDHTVPAPFLSWVVKASGELTQQMYSSTAIRKYFRQREVRDQTLPLSSEIVAMIRQRGLYQGTDAEFSIHHLLEEVKKVVEVEVGKNKLVSTYLYPLSIRLVKDMGISGLSGDVVFFVMGKNGHSQFVVKIFCGTSHKKNYESELIGFQKIGGAGLKKVAVPTLLFSHQNDNFSLIGMSIAAGKRLIDLMSDSKEAVRLCAEACLELHLHARVPLGHIEEERLKIFDEAVEKVSTRLEESKGDFLSITLDRLWDHWNQIRRSFLANPGWGSFTHGDPNAGNWIVDLDNEKVTFIDLSLFSRSVKTDGNPCGFAINEYLESISSFWIVGERIGLSQDVIQGCQKEFAVAYDKLKPEDIATRESYAYFDCYWLLRGINTLFKRLENASMGQKEQIREEIAGKFAKFFANR